MIGLNCGSGQRPFSREHGWINIDINPRWEPDIVGDWTHLPMFTSNSVDYVVSVHSIEHAGCGESDGFIKEAYRVLRQGGSFIVLTPDMMALAQGWIMGKISEQIYMTNVYGAYMGADADRHKWGWSHNGLVDYLLRTATWSACSTFDNRAISGADIPSDWWMNSIEAIK